MPPIRETAPKLVRDALLRKRGCSCRRVRARKVTGRAPVPVSARLLERGGGRGIRHSLFRGHLYPTQRAPRWHDYPPRNWVETPMRRISACANLTTLRVGHGPAPRPCGNGHAVQSHSPEMTDACVRPARADKGATHSGHMSRVRPAKKVANVPAKKGHPSHAGSAGGHYPPSTLRVKCRMTF